MFQHTRDVMRGFLERFPIRLNVRSHRRIRNRNFRRRPHLKSSTKRIEYLGSSSSPGFRVFSSSQSEAEGWSEAKARGHSASIVVGFGSPINYFAHVSISIKKQRDVTHILSLKQQKPFCFRRLLSSVAGRGGAVAEDLEGRVLKKTLQMNEVGNSV